MTMTIAQSGWMTKDSMVETVMIPLSNSLLTLELNYAVW